MKSCDGYVQCDTPGCEAWYQPVAHPECPICEIERNRKVSATFRCKKCKKNTDHVQLKPSDMKLLVAKGASGVFIKCKECGHLKNLKVRPVAV